MALLALLPLLAWYKIPFPVGLGYALLLFLSAYTIIRRGFRINVLPSKFWIIFVYICFMWMYSHNFGFWTVLPPGGWNFFIFFLALLWGIMCFDLVLLKKYMRLVVLISGVLFWIQFVFMITTGSPQFCFVPNLTGAFIYENYIYSKCHALSERDGTCIDRQIELACKPYQSRVVDGRNRTGGFAALLSVGFANTVCQF